MLMVLVSWKRDVVKTFPLELAGINAILWATRVKEYSDVSSTL
jgi:hypothetical protein